MKIISWNVNGIRAVANKNALEWIDEYQPDVLCLQEIKALPKQIPEALFTHEMPYTKINSAEKKGYSGTMTFSNREPDLQSTCKFIDTENEGRIIEQHYDDIAILGVYFPNGQKNEERLAYKMKFYDSFLEHCNTLRADGKSVIICGDVNTAHKEIDLKNPKSNSKTSGFLPIEREWIDKLVDNGYVDTFRYVHGDVEERYSWWSYRFGARMKNIGWRIDYVFIADDLCEYLEDAFILDDITGSDHCPVGITLSL
ncbi:MAG: exodeoxyribonuclease III [Campylobacterota bacterium]|nr:exodeoxyribonuclease III [Campylobacterota bacterium]